MAVKEKRSRVSQADVPAFSLSDALKVPMAIFENYAGDPTPPLGVASAMSLSPGSSQFKMITGASIAYGLTNGGYNASSISVTDLARKIIKPTEEGADHSGKVEALMHPRVIKEFLDKYDQNSVPKDAIALNVLEGMGVPSARTEKTLRLILESADELGIITDIKGKKYINIKSIVPRNTATSASDDETELDADDFVVPEFEVEEVSPTTKPLKEIVNRKVFITHGHNKGFIEPIKKLLKFGEMEAVVSVEKQSVSQPVPEKVMRDMRECGAAIIHVEQEQTLLDKEANEHPMLNPNVLIEIGAAMALYDKRFILLVREGIKLPSNLQGLYEVRYSGENLDGDTTIKLLEAINALKAEGSK
ncbi:MULTISPECIES: TIR domain-containing protein [unclassified Thalassospira]|uniref:TIR domain-containing protein n=1 Tax=unclassified Thalassospira TaxID=2648997 RepID=UPI000B17E1D4|nr:MULTISPECIES: TIR domain-containing protein [unclassified Thalassospira]